MDEQNWTDETLPDNVAVISICCTEPVRTNFVHARYDGADDTHRFSHRNNVLNLDFDDINYEEQTHRAYRSYTDDSAGLCPRICP